MKHLRKILQEAIKLDVEKGDVILTGRFKNKRRIVKSIGTDKYGQPTINGKSILKFKIEKHMPKSKMSAKTREEMNEMKSLRRTIQKILLEQTEEQSHFDKLANMIYSKDIETQKQAIELAETMGYITIDEDWNEEYSSYWRNTEIIFTPTPDFMDLLTFRHASAPYDTNCEWVLDPVGNPPGSFAILWPESRFHLDPSHPKYIKGP